MRTSMNFGAAMLLMLFFACSPKGGGGGDGKSPEEYKQDILGIKSGLDEKLPQLEQRRFSIEIQGRGLSDSELKWLDEYGGLMYSFEEWKTAWEKGGKDSQNTSELQEYLDKIKILDKKADDLAQ